MNESGEVGAAVAIERERREGLLEAMLIELAEHGYENASVSAALERSGVSRAEFEREFGGSKDACLFAAYEELAERALGRAAEGCDARDEWPVRVRGGLASLLEAIARAPAMARVATRAFPAIRPAAYQRYVDLTQRFVALVAEGREYSGVGEELPDEVELLAVGAAESLIFSELDAGRAERLPAMMPEILFSLLVPFLGPERAAEEMQIARAAG